MNLSLVLIVMMFAGTFACSTGSVPSVYNGGEVLIIVSHADDTPDERHKWYDFRRGLFKKDCASGYAGACQRIKEIDVEERDYFNSVENEILSH